MILELALAILVSLIAVTLLTIVFIRQSTKEKPDLMTPAQREAQGQTLCPHEWRSIAHPYVNQCRKCGYVKYNVIDSFPDGIREYMTWATRIPRCDCGASMVLVEDEEKGPIWYCTTCESWRKRSV
jgi:hypothetical protein